MSKILCLANSFKEGGRCVAGLDLDNGKFVRPVSETKSQVIPEEWTTLNGQPLKPLDIVDIPFVNGDAIVPFQSENRYCVKGWKLIGNAPAESLCRYCSNSGSILGTTDSEGVTERALKLQSNGRMAWKSLQLIQPNKVTFLKIDGKWEGQFRGDNRKEYCLRVTDELFTETLKDRTDKKCILLLSLTRPWRHYMAPKSKPKKCYKLIAGVIPLK